MQADLFSTLEVRPEDDPFVRAIVARFDGRITGIGPLKVGPRREVAQDDGRLLAGQPAYAWIETIRPRAERHRAAIKPGRGKTIAAKLMSHEEDGTERPILINVRNRSQAKNGINIGAWQIVWEG